MEELQIVEVKQADMLAAINRSEVDMQIATAKQYPRDIQQSLNRILTIATLDEETASECFYLLRRGNGGQVIEGLSVRFAEIIAGAWGNLRAQARIIPKMSLENSLLQKISLQPFKPHTVVQNHSFAPKLL